MRRWYKTIDVGDLVKVQPGGYKLAVLRVPFSRKFRITWWLDGDGKLARKAAR